MPKCAQCGKEGEMHIGDCGLDFCSSECKELYRYRPNMTDETFEWDTTIDEIERDGGKEFITIETVDALYFQMSGYKVIAVVERMFYHKQLNGFKTIAAAREWWDGQKKKYNLTSWADKHDNRDA